MWMNLEMLKSGRRCDLFDHEPHRHPRQSLAPLTDKELLNFGRRIHLLAFDQPGPDGTRLAVIEWMQAGIGPFQPGHMKFSRFQVDVRQLQRAKLTDSQAMT